MYILGPVEVAEEAESANLEDADNKNEAAGQIMTLLSQIGSSEMLNCEPSALEQRFQPWFWEPNQGKLMTV